MNLIEKKTAVEIGGPAHAMDVGDPGAGRHPDLRIKRVRGMGRGVFAGRPFHVGQNIEVCPVIVLLEGIEEGALGNLRMFVFKWGKADDRLAIALGYGSLYNHSADPNAEFVPRYSRGEIEFRAVRPIEAGDQIFVDYYWADSDYATFSRTGATGS